MRPNRLIIKYKLESKASKSHFKIFEKVTYNHIDSFKCASYENALRIIAKRGSVVGATYIDKFRKTRTISPKYFN